VVLADDSAAFFRGDLCSDGIGDDVGSACQPAGGDPGQPGGRDMAERRVVVPVGGHQPGVFRGAPGIGLAGAVGGGEHRFTQQCVAGLGQAVLRAG
jgi:hypothetical protein